MRLLPGWDTFAQIVKGEISQLNGAPVPFQASTLICAAGAFNVAVGDILLVSWTIHITVGANSGVRAVVIQKESGAGDFVSGANQGFARTETQVTAGAGNPYWTGLSIFTVLSPGDFTVGLYAEAAVAGSSVATSEGQIRAYHIRGR